MLENGPKFTVKAPEFTSHETPFIPPTFSIKSDSNNASHRVAVFACFKSIKFTLPPTSNIIFDRS